MTPTSSSTATGNTAPKRVPADPVRTEPVNKLTAAECERVLQVCR
jgi:hypothetical protein